MDVATPSVCRQETFDPDEYTLSSKHVIDSGRFTRVVCVTYKKKEKDGREIEIKFIKKVFLLDGIYRERAKKSYTNEIVITEYLTKNNMAHLCPKILGCENNEKEMAIYYEYGGMDIYEFFSQKETEEIFDTHRHEIITKMLDVVIELHSVGVVHLDIKPENFVIDYETMTVKIIDFSGSFIKHPSIEPDYNFLKRHSVGTSFYMSPESTLKGVRDYSCDIWSTVVTIYVLSVGKNIQGLSGYIMYSTFNEDGIVNNYSALKIMYEGIYQQAPQYIRNKLFHMPELQILSSYIVDAETRPTDLTPIRTEFAKMYKTKMMS